MLEHLKALLRVHFHSSLFLFNILIIFRKQLIKLVGTKKIAFKPNNLTTYEDDALNILIKAQDYLESEEILKTTETLKLIEDSEIFFSNWFNQAHIYVEFISTLRKII